MLLGVGWWQTPSANSRAVYYRSSVSFFGILDISFMFVHQRCGPMPICDKVLQKITKNMNPKNSMKLLQDPYNMCREENFTNRSVSQSRNVQIHGSDDMHARGAVSRLHRSVGDACLSHAQGAGPMPAGVATQHRNWLAGALLRTGPMAKKDTADAHVCLLQKQTRASASVFTRAPIKRQ